VKQEQLAGTIQNDILKEFMVGIALCLTTLLRSPGAQHIHLSPGSIHALDC
jgi:hypothetical protein